MTAELTHADDDTDVRADTPGSDDEAGGWGARISLAALVVPVIVLVVGSWTYRWVQEDAFINFRVIDNLLAGHGPVYNVGERVEVYSDPLWLFFLAAVHEITPFLSIEWLSVYLGIGFTVAGMVFGGRALQRLGGSRGDRHVLPIGLLIFSAVPAVWEFTTGGLEMGMVFAWIGFSYWLLVRTERTRDSALWCAFVVGLGPLIRPELALMTGAFLGALGLVVVAPGWKGRTGVLGRYVFPLIVAFFVPVLYELWRMAYFGMLVANTALTKSGGSTWWSQGLVYLLNFVIPYALWIPLIVALPLCVPRLVKWWRSGDRIGFVVGVTPLVAGSLDVLYVARLGGDYMHARLLLPAFLALCLGVYARADQLRAGVVIAVTCLLIWAIACAGFLRTGLARSPDGAYVVLHRIADERMVWITLTGNRHPITTADWGPWSAPGSVIRADAGLAEQEGRQVMIVVPDQAFPRNVRQTMRARSTLPIHVVTNIYNIGSIAYAAGPDVYVFDTLSLANPIGSHTLVTHRGRPGHEKPIGVAWMIARFGLVGDKVPTRTASAASIAAARQALGCDPLRSYLHAITAPLTFSQALTDFTHSYSWTTMSFSANPVIAARQLCP